MNFFQAQDQARVKTGRLIWLFVVLIFLLSFLSYFALQIGNYLSELNRQEWQQQINFQWWDVKRYSIVLGVVLLFLGGVAYYKYISLSRNTGAVIARSLGGVKINIWQASGKEKQLLNVVEEMAIATGVMMPEVWVIPTDYSINAFAAGTTVNTAVIGVTKGAITQLSRSELQGVIAHEFSHILNGDMRLNIKLISWIYAIMALSIIGEILIYASWGSSRSKKEGGGYLIILGIALYIMGIVGMIIGKIIQQSISRQREFLADASATQFTRNPQGLASALRKIAGLQNRQQSAQVHSELSHLFIAAPVTKLSDWLSSHPPVTQRIAALENKPLAQVVITPYQAIVVKEGSAATDESNSKQSNVNKGLAGLKHRQMKSPSVEASGKTNYTIDETWLIEKWGTEETVSENKQQKQTLDKWLQYLTTEYEIKSFVFALIISSDTTIANKSFAYLSKHYEQQMITYIQIWQMSQRNISKMDIISLLEIVLGRLKGNEQEDLIYFSDRVSDLIHLDGSVNLNEWLILHLLQQQLNLMITAQDDEVCYKEYAQITTEINILVSTFASVGAVNEQQQKQAWQKTNKYLLDVTTIRFSLYAAEKCHLEAIKKAINKVAKATLLMKKKIAIALILASNSDGCLSDEEVSLLKIVCDTWQLPALAFLIK